MCPLFTLGLADPYLARKAKQQTKQKNNNNKNKRKQRLAPCIKHANTVYAQYPNILLYIAFLSYTQAKSITWDFDSAVVFFLEYTYYFCLLFLPSLINFSSHLTSFLVSQRAVLIPWKEIQNCSQSNYYHKLSGDLQLANLSTN